MGLLDYFEESIEIKLGWEQHFAFFLFMELPNYFTDEFDWKLQFFSYLFKRHEYIALS
jgi:hypothetical protein